MGLDRTADAEAYYNQIRVSIPAGPLQSLIYLVYRVVFVGICLSHIGLIGGGRRKGKRMNYSKR